MGVHKHTVSLQDIADHTFQECLWKCQEFHGLLKTTTIIRIRFIITF